jgi:hypothetical protein
MGQVVALQSCYKEPGLLVSFTCCPASGSIGCRTFQRIALSLFTPRVVRSSGVSDPAIHDLWLSYALCTTVCLRYFP